MKVIFLDIDGVVAPLEALEIKYNKNNTIRRRHKRAMQLHKKIKFKELSDRARFIIKWRSGYENLQRKPIKELNKIIKETGAEVVITSSWRLHRTRKFIDRLMKAKGFKGHIIDMTSKKETRKDEIIEWLKSHSVESYIVLDDDINGIENEINTNMFIGLTREDREKAIKMLV